MEREPDKQPNASRKRPRFMSVVLFALFLVSALVVVLFSIPDLFPIADERTKRLLTDTAPRLALAVFLIAAIASVGEKSALSVPKGKRLFGLLWSVPCFLVAFANFPYTALLSGSAKVERPDLLWLFLLKCASVALMEELFFRALLLPFVRERIKGKLAAGWTTLVTAAAFALTHLFNLLFGADVGGTFLQVGYTFLLGCMFAVLFMETENIWLCVGVHFVFDAGGVLVPDLGSGAFQDTTFWILTALSAAVCAAEVVATLVRIMKRENAQKGNTERDGT